MFSSKVLLRNWSRRLLLLPAVAALALISSLALAGSIPCDCESCHGNHHGDNWGGCTACHETPPTTGSHPLHYNDGQQNSMRYGDTAVTSTADAYRFGCGNCHPLDRAKHRDNIVEVELHDPLSPPGSLKAMNDATAAWNPQERTCSGVYCHSAQTVTSSSEVGEPLTYPASPVPPGYVLNGSYIMDPTCSSTTYAPWTVATRRIYATTPAWGSTGAFTDCRDCHGFPQTTYSPAVSSGVGDSHQWIDPFGYRNLHAYNMGFEPVPCRTCHSATVTQTNGYHYVGTDEIQYNPVPIASRATHVNGAPDVSFDSINPVIYNRHFYSLASATFDPATKTCSDVACHFSPPETTPPRTSPRWQRRVQWGSPYRWWTLSAECDLCHRETDLAPTCVPAP